MAENEMVGWHTNSMDMSLIYSLICHCCLVVSNSLVESKPMDCNL